MDKLVKGITAVAAGSIAWRVIKEVRRRKSEKELYEVVEQHDKE